MPAVAPGFAEGRPVFIKGDFAASEVEVRRAEPMQYGALVDIVVAGTVWRYFVPWDGIEYLRQERPDIPAIPGNPAPPEIKKIK